MARGVRDAMRFSLRGRKARCCQKPGSWERQAPLPGLVCMALCFRRGSSQVWKSWFDESFGTKLLTGASLLMNLIPSFRCVDGHEFSQRLGVVRLLEGGGRGRSENEKRQSIEIDLSFRSKKERRRKVEMARSDVLWRGYAHQALIKS